MRTAILATMFRFSKQQRRRYVNMLGHGFSREHAAYIVRGPWQDFFATAIQAFVCAVGILITAVSFWVVFVLALSL